MSARETNAAKDESNLDDLPPGSQQALHRLNEYARRPRQLRSAEELAEVKENICQLTEELMRTLLAAGFKTNRSLSPELKRAADEMVRNFSMRRDALG